MTRRLLRHPLAWGSAAAAALLAMVMTFSYLGAFLDPQGNMRDMPLAVVNADSGAEQAGQPVNLGSQVVAAVTARDPQLGNAVRWQLLPSRAEAMRRLGENKLDAVIVAPADFSERVLALGNASAAAIEPAQLEVITNPAVGSIPYIEAQTIATGAVTRVSQYTGAQLLSTLRSAGATVPPALVRVLADPVQPLITVGQPIGAKSGRGLSAFYFAVMLTLAGFVGANLVSIGVDYVAGRQDLEYLATHWHRDASGISRLALWRLKLGLTLAMSILTGALQTWLAVGLLGMSTSHAALLALFAGLGVAATALPTLAFLTAFGTIGLLPSLLFTTIFGVPSAGGVYPLQMLPGFFRFLAAWLPLRYMTDGSRALLYYGGRMQAGLATSLWVLGGYVLGTMLLSGLIASLIDRALRRGAAPSVVATPVASSRPVPLDLA